MKRLLSTLLLFFAFSHALPAFAQEQQEAEVLKVNTRVVFLDALVTDKKTKAYVGDLKLENFEVLADGRTRQITYFTREGDAARRALALVLIFDLERIGAGRYMRRTDILEAMAKELEKLPPGDEAAVVVLDPGGQEGRREWLTPFTRNRGQLASALSIIPTLVGEGGFGSTGEEAEAQPVGASPKESRGSVEVSVGTSSRPKVDVEPEKTQQALERKSVVEEGDEVDTITNRKGEKITRKLRADGTLLITKVNKKGEEETDVHDDFDLPRAVYEATRRIARERPNSQPAVVYVTDGIALMDFDERDYVEERLIRQNVIFSALVGDMKTGFRLAKPILAPLGNWAGLGIYGVSQHVAKATGGDVVRVHGPADYARGLSQIIGNLTARYSLGFTLADAEADDGLMHTLEVRARAKDERGRERKLEIKARRGFFMPATPAKPQEAKKEETGGTPQVKNE